MCVVESFLLFYYFLKGHQFADYVELSWLKPVQLKARPITRYDRYMKKRGTDKVE